MYLFHCRKCKHKYKASSNFHKPQVVCNSHKLNLEVNNVESSRLGLNTAIDCVRYTMKSKEIKMTNAVILSKNNELFPWTNTKTHLSVMYRVLSQFDRL